MVKIDEKFLEAAGLANVPNEQKQTILEGARKEYEKRLGERMAESLSLDQLKEFNAIMSDDKDVILRFLESLGDYKSDEVYKKLLEKHGASEETYDLMREYLSVKWVQINQPRYNEISDEVASEIKKELTANFAS